MKMHDAGSKTMTATKLVKPNVKFQTLTHNTVKFTFPPGEKREMSLPLVYPERWIDSRF